MQKLKMVNFLGLSIEPDKIISFLKRDIQLKEVCQKILEQRIIAQAAQERSLIVTSEEIQTETERFRREKHLGKAIEMAWLTDQMITADDWEAGIRDRLLAQKLSESLFAKEVEKFFAKNRLNFDQVLLYQIVVPYAQLAQELFYQIEESEINFYQAAHLYDIDERRRYQCGYEGKLYRWNLKPALAAVVFSVNLGELVGPVTTEQGSHLLLVEEFIPAELTPERYQDILNQMFRQWLESELNYRLHSPNI